MSVGILIALGIEAGIAAQVWAGSSGSYWTSLAAFWIVLVLI